MLYTYSFQTLSNGTTVCVQSNGDWLPLSLESYCVDGIQNYGVEPYNSGSLRDQVLFLCPKAIAEPKRVRKLMQEFKVMLIPNIIKCANTLFFLLWMSVCPSVC